MAQYQPKPNTGTLWQNERKKTDRDPDYTGSFCGPDGREFWVSAWWNPGKNNKPGYMKFNIGREKEPRDGQHAQSGGYAHPAQHTPAQPPLRRPDNLPHTPVGGAAPGDPNGPPWAAQHPVMEGATWGQSAPAAQPAPGAPPRPFDPNEDVPY